MKRKNFKVTILRNSNMILIQIILASFLILDCIEARANHHKVHNLALFPERHSWCEPQPIRQEISAQNPECEPYTIDNVVCLGACFSYSVPRGSGTDDAVIPPYCDACRPTKSSWTTVALNCTKADILVAYKILRNVELIASCSCVDCSTSKQKSRIEEEESSGDLIDDSGELPSSKESDPTLPVDDLEEEDDNGEDGEDETVDLQSFPGLDLPTLHKLKSASAELKGIPKAAEDLMIKDNKITPDDDLRS